MKRRLRPARPLAPLVASPLILFAWWMVAHNSGAGWVQVLGDIVFGTLLVGVLGPAVVLAQATVRVSGAPMDATAGLPVEVRLQASTRLRVRPVIPAGSSALVGPAGRAEHDDSVVVLVPKWRGVHDTLTLELASAAPFGLQWWKRRVVLPFPAPLSVAPRYGKPVALAVQPEEHAGDSVLQANSDSGEPRGARPYRPGDNRRHVHWRASAHTGELMVRELEGPAAEPVKVVVVLPADPDAAERVAERALATVVRLLDLGAPVLLATTEATGPVVAEVSERTGAGRRLARAVAGGVTDEASAISVSL